MRGIAKRFNFSLNYFFIIPEFNLNSSLFHSHTQYQEFLRIIVTEYILGICGKYLKIERYLHS